MAAWFSPKDGKDGLTTLFTVMVWSPLGKDKLLLGKDKQAQTLLSATVIET